MRRNSNLFERLATLIEDDPSYWDQSRWVEPGATCPGPQPRCLASLTAVLTGALPHHKTGGLVKPLISVRVTKPELCDLHLVSDAGYILLSDYARIVLGLTRDDADTMFDPDFEIPERDGDIGTFLRRIGNNSNEKLL